MYTYYTCGKCGRQVNKNTTRCPHCGVLLSGIRPVQSRSARSSASGKKLGWTGILMIVVVASVAMILVFAEQGGGISKRFGELAAGLASTTAEPEADAVEAPAEQTRAAVVTEAPAPTVHAAAADPTKPPVTATPAPQPTTAADERTRGGEWVQALSGAFDGEKLSVLVSMMEGDSEHYQTLFAPFEDASGVTVELIEAEGMQEQLDVRIAVGDPPDVVLLRDPQLVHELAASGAVVDLDHVLDARWLREQYGHNWLDLSRAPSGVGTILASIWVEYDIAGGVFYSRQPFDDAGYVEPASWDELEALIGAIEGTGATPWCLGAESELAAGFFFSQWLDELLLRTAPMATYDALANGELNFNSDRLGTAFDLVEAIWFDEDGVGGGRAALTNRTTEERIADLFAEPPGCWLLSNTFLTRADFPDEARYGWTYGWFPLPPMEATDGIPYLVYGEQAVLLDDTPAGRALIAYLTSGEALHQLLADGDSLAPQRDTQSSWYGDPLRVDIARHVADATLLRTDAWTMSRSGGEMVAFWNTLGAYIAGDETRAGVIAMLSGEPVASADSQPAATTVPVAPQPTRAPAIAQPTAPPAAADAVALAGVLELRDGPGWGYAVIASVAQNAGLSAIGQFSNCAWVQLRAADGTSGWAPGDGSVVRLDRDCGTIADGIFRPFTMSLRNTQGGGWGELQVSNGTDQDGVVVLATQSDQTVQSAYIRSGESFRMSGILDGTYRLFFSTGEEWNGNQRRFTRNERTQRFDELFPFESAGVSYTVWEVTLHGVTGGTATASDVPSMPPP